MLSTSSIVKAVAAIVLVTWAWKRTTSWRRFQGIPRVGIDPGLFGVRLQAAKNEFFNHGQKLLEQGYERHKSIPYLVRACEGERLVIPDIFIDELKNLPDTQISFKEGLLERFMGEYTKLDAVRGTNVHRDIVRHQLTKKLDNLVPQMKIEADLALENILSRCNSKDYVPVQVSSLILAAIGRITSRRVIDDSLISQDSKWLETIMGFTASVVIFTQTMTPVPPALRPVVQRFAQCGRKLRADVSEVTRLLSPVIEARKNGSHIETRGGRTTDQNHSFTGSVEPQDFAQWLLDSAKGSDIEADAIVMKLLFLIVTSIHQSATAAIHAIYDVCAHRDFMEELRAEVRQEIGTHGWSYTMLLKLRKMDSFLKESGRVNSAALVSFQRLVLTPIRLSNGFTIPAGTHICAAADARSRDPKLYESPTEFRPLRFYKSLSSSHAGAETEAANSFTSVAAGDSWFGTGRQACPGRWYASAQIKLVLCLLLFEYEFKYPEGQIKRPRNWFKDEWTGPDMEQIIMVKRRATL